MVTIVRGRVDAPGGTVTVPDAREVPARPVRARWLAAHPLLGFVLIAYAISWSLWALAWVIGESTLAGVVFVGGVLGPAAAAVIVQVRLGQSLRPWASAIVRWRVAPRYVVFALGLPVALFGSVNVSLALLGAPIEWSLLGGRILPYLATLIGVMLVFGGPEEPGWRGFLLPRLQARHTPLRATLLLGVIWGTWHVPLYGPLGVVVPLLLAFFYTWLYNRTGSVLLAVVLHGGLTASQDHLVLLAEETHGVTDLAIGAAYVVGVVTLVLATGARLGYRGQNGVTLEEHRYRDQEPLGG